QVRRRNLDELRVAAGQGLADQTIVRAEIVPAAEAPFAPPAAHARIHQHARAERKPRGAGTERHQLAGDVRAGNEGEIDLQERPQALSEPEVDVVDAARAHADQ